MAAAQGLFNALYAGLAAAETAERYLSNAADELPSCERAIADIWNTCAAWKLLHENARAPSASHFKVALRRKSLYDGSWSCATKKREGKR
jgi:hypothetical protein